MNATSPARRSSYRGLMALDAYLLYEDTKLVASVRAHGPQEARQIFKHHGLSGTHMRRSVPSK